MLVRVTAPFRYAFGGHRVVEFVAGDQVLADEVADVALREGWAIEVPTDGASGESSDAPKEPAPADAPKSGRRGRRG